MTYIRYLSYWIKVIGKIFSSQYPYSRAALLFAYVRIFARSVAYHKMPALRPKEPLLRERLLGFDVRFQNYGQLLALFEEIFIRQIYYFKSNTDTPAIIDCGSNIGLSVLFFKKLYPSAKIKAFEPDPASFALLKDNVEQNNLTDVLIYNIALSDAEQETILHKDASPEGTLTMSLFASPLKSSQIKVSAQKLSGYISEKVQFIKADTEGAEIYIINDLLQTNKISLAERLAIEYHADITGVSIDKFIAPLKSTGYSCKISDNDFHREATDKMIYCTRNN